MSTASLAAGVGIGLGVAALIAVVVMVVTKKQDGTSASAVGEYRVERDAQGRIERVENVDVPMTRAPA